MTTIQLIDAYTSRIVRDILTASAQNGGRAWRHIIRTELLSLALEIVIRNAPEDRHGVFPARTARSSGRKSKLDLKRDKLVKRLMKQADQEQGKLHRDFRCAKPVSVSPTTNDP